MQRSLIIAFAFLVGALALWEPAFAQAQVKTVAEIRAERAALTTPQERAANFLAEAEHPSATTYASLTAYLDAVRQYREFDANKATQVADIAIAKASAAPDASDADVVWRKAMLQSVTARHTEAAATLDAAIATWGSTPASGSKFNSVILRTEIGEHLQAGSGLAILSREISQDRFRDGPFSSSLAYHYLWFSRSQVGDPAVGARARELMLWSFSRFSQVRSMFSQHWPMVINGLVSASSPEQRVELAMAALRHADAFDFGDSLLSAVVPEDSAMQLAYASAQTSLDRFKAASKRKEGRINSVLLTSVAEQLDKGGDARPFSSASLSPEVVAAAEASPIKDYLVPMVKGDYKAAIKAAYARAMATDSDVEYKRWIETTAATVRCLDQCYNQRALQFIRWANSEVDVNPIADVLN